MRIALLAVSLLALAGCGGADEPVANEMVNAAPALPPGPTLGNFELDQPIRAFGTEPYWTLDVAPGDIAFTDYSAADPKPAPVFPISPAVADGKAVWTTSNVAGEAVVLTLTLKDCEAGEADQTRPLTAELKIGSRVRTGCAGPKPETGPDEEMDNASAP